MYTGRFEEKVSITHVYFLFETLKTMESKLIYSLIYYFFIAYLLHLELRELYLQQRKVSYFHH